MTVGGLLPENIGIADILHLRRRKNLGKPAARLPAENEPGKCRAFPA
jgi:hypothetical protein